MPDATRDPERTVPAPRRHRRRRGLAIALVVVVGGVVAFLVAAWIGILVFHAREDRPLPEFPALATEPDPALHGTVATYAPDTGCVRLVAAAGRPTRDVYCLPEEGPDVWVEEGKPVGPQLVWLPDGRLEVTMFRMAPGPGTKTAPPLTAGWQRIVDPRTGAVEEVPADRVPSRPDEWPGATTDPSGRTVEVDFDPTTGTAEVALESDGRSRTLLSVHGPGEYTYSFGPAFWAPDGQWIAAADTGRILVITPGRPARTRVLVTGVGEGAGGGTAGPWFAVTADDVLTAAG